MTTLGLDLTTCDTERIHLITSIQGHGAFVALHATDLKIRNVSENLSSFFGHNQDASYFVGKRLNDLIALELTSRIHEKIRTRDFQQDGIEHALNNGQMFEIHLYSIADDLIGIEFETHEAASRNEIAIGLNTYLEGMQKGSDLARVGDTACKAIRFLTGYDRVMLYRFFPPTMYGEVIAEDRIASAHSFLHHRFPATDIPKPARDLYLRNKVRYIHDSGGQDYPIYPSVHDRKAPLDLSDSRLRSVSRVHVEYLRNMGVAGSLSVAIIVAGRLWGILACHHPVARFVSQANRRLCLQVANTLAMVAPLMEKLTGVTAENDFHNDLHEFFNEIKLESDPLGALFRKIDKLNNLFGSEGVAYVSPDKVTAAGLTPRNQDLRTIWEFLRKKISGDVFDTDSLMSLDQSFEAFRDQASGVLAVRVSPSDDSMLIFTRPESLTSVLWGGDPRKNLEQRNYNGQINPRASFETWTEVVKGTSRPWSDYELSGARTFRDLVFDSLVQKELLIGELHERLRMRS